MSGQQIRITPPQQVSGSSPAQPTHPASPLRKTGDASAPSPAALDTAAPMRDPSAKGRYRTGGTLNVVSQIRGPHEGPMLPTQQDSQLSAKLAKQREKAGDD